MNAKRIAKRIVASETDIPTECMKCGVSLPDPTPADWREFACRPLAEGLGLCEDCKMRPDKSASDGADRPENIQRLSDICTECGGVLLDDRVIDQNKSFCPGDEKNSCIARWYWNQYGYNSPFTPSDGWDTHDEADYHFVSNDDFVKWVKKMLSQIDIDAREAAILRMRFGLDGEKPMTLKDIGERIGLTRKRVVQIMDDALRHLRVIIKDDHDENHQANIAQRIIRVGSRTLRDRFNEILAEKLKGTGFENDPQSPVYRGKSQEAFAELKKETGRSDINFGSLDQPLGVK